MVTRPAVTTTTLGKPTVFYFFFQAEDGIRVYKVTGVQTCALPICSCADAVHTPVTPRPTASSTAIHRSEERRVGKEGRSRWAQGHQKKREGHRGGEGSREWRRSSGKSGTRGQRVREDGRLVEW